MQYIGLDVHKKTISYCVKNASGQVQQEGTAHSISNASHCSLPSRSTWSTTDEFGFRSRIMTRRDSTESMGVVFKV